MYSQFERQKDKRMFGNKREVYTGPVYGYAAERINPERTVEWGEDGLPIYTDMGTTAGDAPAPQEQIVEEEEE